MERFVERFRYKATKARQAQSRVKALDEDRADRARPARHALARLQLRRGRAHRPRRARAGGRPPRGPRPHPARGRRALARARRARLAGRPQRRRQDDPDRGARRAPPARRRPPQDRATTSSSATSPSTRRSSARPAPRSRPPSGPPASPRARRARCSASSCSRGEEAEKPLDGPVRRRAAPAVAGDRSWHPGANVLILDEPTNHLDLDAREALEDALQAFEGAVLLVSHDRALLDAVGTRTVAFEDGRSAQLPGRLGGVRARARGAPGGGGGAEAPSEARGRPATAAATRSGPSKNAVKRVGRAGARGRAGRGLAGRGRGRARRSRRCGAARPGASARPSATRTPSGPSRQAYAAWEAGRRALSARGAAAGAGRPRPGTDGASVQQGRFARARSCTRSACPAAPCATPS